MSNGHVCCLLGICCPPGSPAQADALAQELIGAGVVADDAQASATAVWVLENFDLAPKGSLAQFKHDIAKMARAKG